MQATPTDQTGSLTGIKQLSVFAAIASLGLVFWVLGAMEMLERLAFAGVGRVSTLYAQAPVSQGGLGVGLDRFAIPLAVGAAIQSFLPVLVGGLADRYGFKTAIACSTILKLAGYLSMARFPSYAGFFAGAIILAVGTALFKPAIQGALVQWTDRRNRSVAWGLFYQSVNVGLYLGPLIAGYLRKLEWAYVFYACAMVIGCNLILLLTYRDAVSAARLRATDVSTISAPPRHSLLGDSWHELRRPHVWTYLAVFAGFWFMFMALFDVLPVYIAEWVDTSDIVAALYATGRSDNAVVRFVVVMNEDGSAIQPEGLLNVNAGLIMFTCVLFAGLSAKLRATTSMTVGTLLASLAMFIVGMSAIGWALIAAIAIFSVGEMLSAPKFAEFMGQVAPPNKRGMYLGFSHLSAGIGWTVESWLMPTLYQRFGSKDRFARELLSDWFRLTPPSPGDRRMWAVFGDWTNSVLQAVTDRWNENVQSVVDNIPQGEAFDRLVEWTRQSPTLLTRELSGTHHVGIVWYLAGTIGILAALGMWLYGRRFHDSITGAGEPGA